MKAAVFYDTEDLRLEDRPRARGGCGRGGRAGCSPAASAAPTSSTTTARARSARPTARGRSSSATRSAARSSTRASSPSVRARRGRPRRGQPGPELQRLQRLPRRQAAVLREPDGARRDDERRLRRVREDEDRARLQDPRQPHERAGRVRRDALVSRLCGAEGRDRAGELRRRLRPRPGRPLDGAAAEGRGCSGGHRRDEGLPAPARARHRGRPRLERQRRELAVLRPRSRRGDQGRQRRCACRPGARRDRLGEGEPAGDRDLGPRVGRRADGSRRPARLDLGAAPLEPLPRQDDPLLAALSAPVADGDPDPRTARPSTRARSSPTRPRWTASHRRSSGC